MFERGFYNLQAGLWFGFIASFGLLPNNSKLSTYFYIGVLLPALLLFFNSRWRKSFSDVKVLLPVFLFPLLLALSNTWTSSPSDYEPVFYLKQVLFLFFFFFSTFICVQHRWFSWLNFGLLVLISANVNAAYNLYCYVQDTGATVLEGYTLISNPNPLGTYHALAFVVAAYLVSEVSSLKYRVVLLLLALLPVSVVVLSDAKLPLLSLLAASLVFLNRSAFTLQRVGSLTFASLLVMVAICFVPVTVLEYFADSKGFLFSFVERANIWREALGVISENWLVGLGLARELPMSRWPYSHNLFIEAFRVAGAAAGLAAFWLVYSVIGWGQRLAQGSQLGVLLLVWFLIGLWASMYYGSQPLLRPDDRWFLWWLPIALITALTLRAETAAVTPADDR